MLRCRCTCAGAVRYGASSRHTTVCVRARARVFCFFVLNSECQCAMCSQVCWRHLLTKAHSLVRKQRCYCDAFVCLLPVQVLIAACFVEAALSDKVYPPMGNRRFVCSQQYFNMPPSVQQHTLFRVNNKICLCRDHTNDYWWTRTSVRSVIVAFAVRFGCYANICCPAKADLRLLVGIVRRNLRVDCI